MARPDPLPAAAIPVLRRLRDDTGESAQLYVRRGDVRVCVAAAERPSGLRDTVPVGSILPMTAGSAAKVLLAFGDGERVPGSGQRASSPGSAPGLRLGLRPGLRRGLRRGRSGPVRPCPYPGSTPRPWPVSGGRAGL